VYRATIDRRKDIAADVILMMFSLLLIPVLAVSPLMFDLNNFEAMAQEKEASSSS